MNKYHEDRKREKSRIGIIILLLWVTLCITIATTLLFNGRRSLVEPIKLKSNSEVALTNNLDLNCTLEASDEDLSETYVEVIKLAFAGEICKIYGHRYTNVFNHRVCIYCGKEEENVND